MSEIRADGLLGHLGAAASRRAISRNERRQLRRTHRAAAGFTNRMETESGREVGISALRRLTGQVETLEGIARLALESDERMALYRQEAADVEAEQEEKAA